MRGLVVIAVLAVGSIARADTFHVSPEGSDGATGAVNSPWATLQFAAERVRPGDTVVVHPGRYRGFDLRRSGTPTRWITFSARPGATIVADNPSTPDGINIEDVAFVTVEGFTVVGAGRAGIRAVQCMWIRIRGNKSDRNRTWGIFTAFCPDVLIEGNETSRSGRQHGIYVSNSGDRPVIRGNRVWGNHGSGIHVNGDVNMGGDGIITGAVIEDNVIHDNGRAGGSAINCDGVQGAVIRNNLLHGNLANGITLFRIDGGGPSTGNRIVNNTIVMPARSRWCIRLADGAAGNAIHANILFSAHPRRGALDISADSLPGLRSDGNALIGRITVDDAATVMDLAAWRARGFDRRSRELVDLGDLADPNGGDFRLRAGSALIDSGVAEGASPRDLAGNRRPAGGRVDPGAYEHCAPTCRRAPPAQAPVPPADMAFTPRDDRDTRAPGRSRDFQGPGCCRGQVRDTVAPVLLTGLVLVRVRRRRTRD